MGRPSDMVVVFILSLTMKNEAPLLYAGHTNKKEGKRKKRSRRGKIYRRTTNTAEEKGQIFSLNY